VVKGHHKQKTKAIIDKETKRFIPFFFEKGFKPLAFSY